MLNDSQRQWIRQQSEAQPDWDVWFIFPDFSDEDYLRLAVDQPRSITG